jgi:hypothetical protein
MPYLRQTSLAAVPASAWRRIETICSSENASSSNPPVSIFTERLPTSNAINSAAGQYRLSCWLDDVRLKSRCSLTYRLAI